MSRWTIATKFS